MPRSYLNDRMLRVMNMICCRKYFYHTILTKPLTFLYLDKTTWVNNLTRVIIIILKFTYYLRVIIFVNNSNVLFRVIYVYLYVIKYNIVASNVLCSNKIMYKWISLQLKTNILMYYIHQPIYIDECKFKLNWRSSVFSNILKL